MADIPGVVTAKVAAGYVGLSESTLAKLRLNGNDRSIASWGGGWCIARLTWSSGSSPGLPATPRTLMPAS
jgi:hypothetical protein